MATKQNKPVTPAKGAPVKDVKAEAGDFAFGKINFQLLGLSIVLLVVGFMLMAGGKPSDPSVFNPEVFSFRRITLAPLIVMLGYAVGVWAIIKKAD